MKHWFLCSALAAFVGLGTHSHAAEPDSFYITDPVFDALVYIQEAGKQHKETVVLVHGLGDLGAKDWDTLIPALAKKYHVVTFDLPGFGRSSKGNKLYSPTQYARFVKWVVDHYTPYKQQQPVTLIGHSMGGAIALRYTAMFPQTLNRLILVDVAGILHKSAFAKANVQSQLSWKGWLGGLLTKTTQGVSNWLGDAVLWSEKIPMPIDVVLENKVLRSSLLQSNPTMISALALLQENFTQAIAELKVPTRIIWGEDDKIAPLRTGKLLHAKIAGSRFEVIQDAGHTPMKDQTNRFNKVVLQSLTNPPLKHDRLAQGKTSRDASCDDEKGKLFSGLYRNIIINKCKDVHLDKVTAQNITITDSEVDIYFSAITSKQTAMVIENSRVTATVLDIDAEVGIEVGQNSKLDLASVVIRSQKDAIQGMDETISKVVLSISQIFSQYFQGPFHDAVDVSESSSL